MSLKGGGSAASLIALHIGPNPATTTNSTLTMTNYNKFDNLWVHSFDQGIVMDAGPGEQCTHKADSGWQSDGDRTRVHYFEQLLHRG